MLTEPEVVPHNDSQSNLATEDAPLVMMPKTLYKFTYWDDPSNDISYKHSALTAPCVFFAAPSSLNDPFDSQLPMGFDTKSDHEILSHLSSRLNGSKLDIEDFRQKLKHDRMQLLESIRQQDVEKRNQQSGVLSLSCSAVNPLLWAHYSSGNTGFCIGYDADLLYKSIKSARRNEICDFIAVDYRSEFPYLDPFERDDREWFMQWYRTKALNWSYEEEYRFILISPEGLLPAQRRVTISPKCISQVILGCRIDQRPETEIRQEVERLRSENPAIVLLRARMSATEFRYVLSL